MFKTKLVTDTTHWLCGWYRRAISDCRHSSRDESGATLVEFSVMAPLFFLIVFGIIEWGELFYIKNTMTNAAREAARTASVQGGAGPDLNQTNQVACRWLSGSGFSYSITSQITGSCPGQDVTVSITGDAAQISVFNYLGMFTGVTVPSLVVMRRETCPTGATTGTSTCRCNTAGGTYVCN